MSLCEWDPEHSRPAQITFSNPNGCLKTEEHHGCQNEARISVGRDGKWHLCEMCAALPVFDKFKKRTRLCQIEEPGTGDTATTAASDERRMG